MDYFWVLKKYFTQKRRFASFAHAVLTGQLVPYYPSLRNVQLVPDATEIILVADNHTFPRDTRLLKGTTAKVSSIHCGATRFINPKYLSLARKYGLTLHTLETDITNLSTVLEGETITIQGTQHLVTKDGFKPIRKA